MSEVQAMSESAFHHLKVGDLVCLTEVGHAHSVKTCKHPVPEGAIMAVVDVYHEDDDRVKDLKPRNLDMHVGCIYEYSDLSGNKRRQVGIFYVEHLTYAKCRSIEEQSRELEEQAERDAKEAAEYALWGFHLQSHPDVLELEASQQDLIREAFLTFGVNAAEQLSASIHH